MDETFLERGEPLVVEVPPSPDDMSSTTNISSVHDDDSPNHPKKHVASETKEDDNNLKDSNIPSPYVACKDFWEGTKFDPLVLLTMCLGIKNEKGEDLVDPELTLPPYDKKKGKNFKILRFHLISEFNRRVSFLPLSTFKLGRRPRCQNFSRSVLLQHLAKPPYSASTVYTEEDCKFLVEKEKELRAKYEKELSEKECLASAEIPANHQWSDNSVIRLVHCLYDNDDCQASYKTRYAVDDRTVIDARHSTDQARPKSCWELIADYYNSAGFVVNTLYLPDLHPEFTEAKVLTLKDVNHPITADLAKTKLNDLKTKLTHVAAKWERSGNGNGNRTAMDSGFGKFLSTNTGMSANDDILFQEDNRKDFLGNYKPIVLYFWHLCDQADLLPSVFTQLDHAQQANAEHVPTASKQMTGRKKRHHLAVVEEMRAEDLKLKQKVSEGLSSLAFSAMVEQRDRLNKEFERIEDQLEDMKEMGREKNAKFRRLEKRLELRQTELDEIESAIHHVRFSMNAERDSSKEDCSEEECSK